MRFWPAAITTAVMLLLQTTLAPMVSIRGVCPDFLLVLAVFWGLFGRRWEAVWAGVLGGLAADLFTLERLGLQGLSYGLAAGAAGWMKGHVYRHRAGAQVLVALVVGLIVRSLWVGYSQILYGVSGGLVSTWLGQGVLGAVYTAGWAPIVLRLLLVFGEWMGVRTRP